MWTVPCGWAADLALPEDSSAPMCVLCTAKRLRTTPASTVLAMVRVRDIINSRNLAPAASSCTAGSVGAGRAVTLAGGLLGSSPRTAPTNICMRFRPCRPQKAAGSTQRCGRDIKIRRAGCRGTRGGGERGTQGAMRQEHRSSGLPGLSSCHATRPPSGRRTPRLAPCTCAGGSKIPLQGMSGSCAGGEARGPGKHSAARTSGW